MTETIVALGTADLPALRAWAVARGLAAGEALSLMVAGDRVLPGDRARLLAPVMTALG